MASLSFKDKLARLPPMAPAAVQSTAPSKPSRSTQTLVGAGEKPGPSALRAMLEALADRHARRAAAERAAHAVDRQGLSSMWGGMPSTRGSAGAISSAQETLEYARVAKAWKRTSSRDGLRILRFELEPDHHHGRVSVTSGLEADMQALAELALDPQVAMVAPHGALFLDTETTGLSLGGGTVPFLVGLAFAVDGALVVEQLFLESLAGEAALLEHLRERVEAATSIVTYNGKSFDWPLLTSRFVLNRVAPPASRPHLDLLTLARRVYRARLGSVRLVQMEVEVLGHRRERDMSGAEIPGTYWSFQRHRQADALLPILEHNLQDVVALAALMGELAARYREIRIEDDPTDQWARARVAFRARSFDRALSFAQAALDGGAASTVAARAALLASEVHRKAKRYQAAAQVLEDSLVDVTPATLEMAQVRLALSKLFEHRLKDLSRALYHAESTALAEGDEAHQRRRARLQRRLA